MEEDGDKAEHVAREGYIRRRILPLEPRGLQPGAANLVPRVRRSEVVIAYGGRDDFMSRAVASEQLTYFDSTFVDTMTKVAEAGCVRGSEMKSRGPGNMDSSVVGQFDRDPVFEEMRFGDLPQCTAAFMWHQCQSIEPDVAYRAELRRVMVKDVFDASLSEDLDQEEAGPGSLSSAAGAPKAGWKNARALLLWALRHSTELVQNSGGWVEIEDIVEVLSLSPATVIELLAQLQEDTPKVLTIGHIEDLFDDDKNPRPNWVKQVPWSSTSAHSDVPRLVRAVDGHSLAVVMPQRMYRKVEFRTDRDAIGRVTIGRPWSAMQSDAKDGLLPERGTMREDGVTDYCMLHAAMTSPWEAPSLPWFTKMAEAGLVAVVLRKDKVMTKGAPSLFYGTEGGLLFSNPVPYTYVDSVVTLTEQAGTVRPFTFYSEEYSLRSVMLDPPSFAFMTAFADQVQDEFRHHFPGTLSQWGRYRIVLCRHCGELSLHGCVKCVSCGSSFGYYARRTTKHGEQAAIMPEEPQQAAPAPTQSEQGPLL